jgi:predicted RNase H-like HicB family nuclease
VNVKEILELAKQIQTKWATNVVAARSHELANLQSHLGSTVTYVSITNELTRWVSELSGLANKPRVSRAISKPLLTALTTSLRALSTTLDHAGNGVEWIFVNRNFGSWYVQSIALIRELSLDSAREAESITNAAHERISQDIGALQVATEQVKTFNAGWPNISANISAVEEAEASAKETLEKLNASATEAQEKITAHQEEIDKSATDSNAEIASSLTSFRETLEVANQVLSEAQKIHVEAQKIRGETQSTAAKSKTDLDNSTSALASAIEQEKQTQIRLTKALQNAQMEGLAGSFTRMKDDTSLVIKVEQKRFEWALIYLVAIAIGGLLIEASLGFPKTTVEEFSFRMLKMLSIAVPGIWVAWTTSRKLSALNRVFSDYEYKSASALAYESYRQTVAEAGSDELKQQLLAFAIRSFGENPTRYYDSAKNEASSPFESFLDRLPFLGKNKSETSKTAPQ